jgi:YVTN family beta-propeller protein
MLLKLDYSRCGRIAAFVSTRLCSLLAVLACSFAGECTAADGIEIQPVNTPAAIASANESSASQPADSFFSATNRVVREGIAAEFKMTPLEGVENESKVVAGQNVRIQFKVTDTTTGTPVTALKPAAWVHSADTSEPVEHKVRSFLSGSLARRADLDLNAFYVLAMNEDATISVVDPLFSFGGSKLLTWIRLASPGEDWCLVKNQTRLFVTMPLTNQVAVVDPASWKVVTNILTGAKPRHIALQPDEKYVWVGCEGPEAAGAKSGLTVIDTGTMEVKTQIPLPAGAYDLAFSDDSRYLFVAASGKGALFVIDTSTLQIIKEIATGQGPLRVAYSSLAKAAYVISETDGTILIIAGSSHSVAQRIVSKPGIRSIRFAPGGRFAFIANTSGNEVSVLDAAKNRIVQSGQVNGRPDQVYFSEEQAYIRALETELIIAVPLSGIGQEGKPLPTVEITSGSAPFGRGAGPSLGDGIIPAPERGTILIANAGDQSIYYHREGMAAPMGTFKNFRRQPRAVLVVDRSLREVEPGVYATDVQLNLSGALDVILFLNTPRLIHAFATEVLPDPAVHADKRRIQFALQQGPENVIHAGQKTQLEFKVTDQKTGEPLLNLTDLSSVISNPRNWHDRQPLQVVEPGVYQVEFLPPDPGAYYISFQSPSLKLRLNDMAAQIIYVRGDAAPAEKAVTKN